MEQPLARYVTPTLCVCRAELRVSMSGTSLRQAFSGCQSSERVMLSNIGDLASDLSGLITSASCRNPRTGLPSLQEEARAVRYHGHDLAYRSWTIVYVLFTSTASTLLKEHSRILEVRNVKSVYASTAMSALVTDTATANTELSPETGNSTLKAPQEKGMMKAGRWDPVRP